MHLPLLPTPVFATGMDNCELNISGGGSSTHPSGVPCGSVYQFDLADENGNIVTDTCGFCAPNFPEWGYFDVLNDANDLIFYWEMEFGWKIQSIDYKVGPGSGFNFVNGLLPQVDNSWENITYQFPLTSIGEERVSLNNIPTGCNVIAARIEIVFESFFSGLTDTRRTVYLYNPAGANNPNVGSPYGLEYCTQPCLSTTYPLISNNDLTILGNCTGEKTITRTWTAEDLCGNSANCTQVINVIDTTAPAITCPADITVSNDAGVCSAVVSYAATATDNCDLNSGLTYSTASGSTFPTGTTAVTATATDDCGNSASCTFNVTVNDSEAPVAVCNDLTIQLDGNGMATITASDVDGGSTDNCGIASTTIDNGSFSCSNVGGGGPSSPSAWINEFHYDNDGADQGEFIEIAGTAGLDLTGWSVVRYNGANGTPYGTDALSGILANTSNGVGFFVINLPANGLQNGSPDGIALIDNNGGVVQFISYESNPFTATAGPANGQTSVDINVSESGATPVGFSLQLMGSGSSAGQFTWASPTAATPGAANNGQTFLSGSANTVTLTVTDLSGNVSTCTADITVIDSVAPAAVCQDLTVQLDNAGNATILASDVDNGSSDNCAIDNISIDNGSFDCQSVGSNTVTLTVTDVNGNSSTCTSVVTVEDNVAPVALCNDITVQLDANGSATITASDIDGGSTDACGIASTTIDNNTFTCASVGGGTAPSPSAWINEFHYDNDGADQNESIEIAGTAGLDLTGWSVVRYNGANGTPYGTDALSGILANTSNGVGFFVINLPCQRSSEWIS